MSVVEYPLNLDAAPQATGEPARTMALGRPSQRQEARLVAA
ncbi:hypothetical protein [Haloactinomyces albus]|uniref:Uncharacterized protein n=1 Tax=Haloactinomyces albus TaxID=1352928 RepID=A0AAE3ZG98_9ACTN|nr:hypothetical protein [Haloactinomyces albus]MDR7304368.1 hypothetical protein [Haloactinomyces albus]